MMGSRHIQHAIVCIRSIFINITYHRFKLWCNVSWFRALKNIKDEKMKTKERGSHDLYDEPGVVGSLGGVAPYAKAQKISIAQVKKEFEKSFAYRLHKQGR